MRGLIAFGLCALLGGAPLHRAFNGIGLTIHNEGVIGRMIDNTSG